MTRKPHGGRVFPRRLPPRVLLPRCRFDRRRAAIAYEHPATPISPPRSRSMAIAAILATLAKHAASTPRVPQCRPISCAAVVHDGRPGAAAQRGCRPVREIAALQRRFAPAEKVVAIVAKLLSSRASRPLGLVSRWLFCVLVPPHEGSNAPGFRHAKKKQDLRGSAQRAFTGKASRPRDPARPPPSSHRRDRRHRKIR